MHIVHWGEYLYSPLLMLLDGWDEAWFYLDLFAQDDTQTVFTVKMSGKTFSLTSAAPFFPLQWTKVCFSFNANNSEATFVVDGFLFKEMSFTVEKWPQNVTVVLGLGDGNQETPGQITNLNIFSAPFPNKSKVMTMSGTDICGASGDYLNWEEATWTLHSEARFIEVDSAEGPCRRVSNMHIYPMRPRKKNIYPMKEYHDQSYCMKHCEK